MAIGPGSQPDETGRRPEPGIHLIWKKNPQMRVHPIAFRLGLAVTPGFALTARAEYDVTVLLLSLEFDAPWSPARLAALAAWGTVDKA